MNNNNNLQSQIQNLVAQAKIEDALDLFAQWAKTNNADLYNSIILLKGRYNTSKRNENLGMVSFSDAARDRAIISNSILELTKQIDASKSPENDAPPPPNEANKPPVSNKILFLASNPINTNKLDLEKEFVKLYSSLQDGNTIFTIYTEWTVTPQDLITALLKQRPRVLHFSGHGAGGGTEGDRALGLPEQPTAPEAGIYLQDAASNLSKLVSGQALAGLFKICLKKFPIEVVLLNACHSEAQAKAISEAGVPYVIGMNRAVKDSTAITFSAGFYRGLSSENDVEFAFSIAVDGIMLEGLVGDDIPVLYKNGVVVGR